jgi:hypothetical protein
MAYREEYEATACKAVTKTLLDLRKSLREEEAAIDAYIERAHRADEVGHETVVEAYNHIRPEEEQHLYELKLLEKAYRDIGLRNSCPLVKIMYAEKEM